MLHRKKCGVLLNRTGRRYPARPGVFAAVQRQQSSGLRRQELWSLDGQELKHLQRFLSVATPWLGSLSSYPIRAQYLSHGAACAASFPQAKWVLVVQDSPRVLGYPTRRAASPRSVVRRYQLHVTVEVGEPIKALGGYAANTCAKDWEEICCKSAQTSKSPSRSETKALINELDYKSR